MSNFYYYYYLLIKLNKNMGEKKKDLETKYSFQTKSNILFIMQ